MLSKQLRKQLGLGSVSAGDAWSAVAGAAGATEPISQLQRLQRRLSQYTTQKQAYSDAHAGTMLVLYVDSSPIDQAVAGVRLGSEPGLLLACVSSGSEALEAVFGGKWLPDLVLMDVALHDAPASEVAGQMRAAFSPLELPIMLLASRSGEAEALAALEAGVNDFLITAAPHRAAGTHQQPGDDQAECAAQG